MDQRSSAVISGHQRSSVAMCGNEWQWMVISGHPWSSVVIRWHPWSSVVIGGHQCQSHLLPTSLCWQAMYSMAMIDKDNLPTLREFAVGWTTGVTRGRPVAPTDLVGRCTSSISVDLFGSIRQGAFLWRSKQGEGASIAAHCHTSPFIATHCHSSPHIATDDR